MRGLAAHSGFSASYLSRVENGQRQATAAIVRLYTRLSTAKTDSRVTQEANIRQQCPVTDSGLGIGPIWFGSEVRRLRITAGKSLSALGAEVYLSRAYLGKIEQGQARASYQHALSLDRALGAQGSLTRLFLEECARVGPVAPDTDILARGGPTSGAVPGLDSAERAAVAVARLETLRIRGHQAGPHSIVDDLGDGVIELYNLAVSSRRALTNPVWPVMLRYAELLGWTAQETGHDAIALRWTRAVADWAHTLGDTDALGYALIRKSQLARRSGDAGTAVDLARKAGTLPGLSSRVAQFAAQREAQACALARDELAFYRALDRYHALIAVSSPCEPQGEHATAWGPVPDPAFEYSRLLEATCLVDLADFRTAASLFDQGMARLGSARTGYARLAIRQAIAFAHVGEPEHACQVVLDSLPTLARQGSASLRGDLKLLTHVLNRHRRCPAVRALLPDLTTVARATASAFPTAAQASIPPTAEE